MLTKLASLNVGGARLSWTPASVAVRISSASATKRRRPPCAERPGSCLATNDRRQDCSLQPILWERFLYMAAASMGRSPDFGPFDLLITTDQILRYQQNLTGRKVAILVLPTTSWPEINKHTADVAAAVW